MKKIGYIGNYYKIPEYIVHSSFELVYVIVEEGCMSDEMFTFLKVRNITFIEVTNSDELIKSIASTGIKQWITCSYGKRIHIEKITDVDIYNIHYAALPLYKGRHPTFYATMADEKKIGISLHEINQKLDEGQIIAQKLVPYYLWEDENILFEKLTCEVPYLLEKLDDYLAGQQIEILSNSEGNYYRPVKPEDYTIDLEKDTPTVIFNKVRAQVKYKGAFLEYQNKEYWIKKVFFSREEYPGTLCIRKEDYYMVFFVESDAE